MQGLVKKGLSFDERFDQVDVDSSEQTDVLDRSLGNINTPNWTKGDNPFAWFLDLFKKKQTKSAPKS